MASAFAVVPAARPGSTRTAARLAASGVDDLAALAFAVVLFVLVLSLFVLPDLVFTLEVTLLPLVLVVRIALRRSLGGAGRAAATADAASGGAPDRASGEASTNERDAVE